MNKFRYLPLTSTSCRWQIGTVPFVVRSKGDARIVGKKIRKRITPLNRSSLVTHIHSYYCCLCKISWRMFKFAMFFFLFPCREFELVSSWTGVRRSDQMTSCQVHKLSEFRQASLQIGQKCSKLLLSFPLLLCVTFADALREEHPPGKAKCDNILLLLLMPA